MNLWTQFRTYISPYTYINALFRYVFNGQTQLLLLPDQEKRTLPLEQQEFQLILPNNYNINKDIEPISIDTNNFIHLPIPNRELALMPETPIIYYEYIDDVIQKYPYQEMYIYRLPDFGLLSVYLIKTSSKDEINKLAISIHIIRYDDHIALFFKGKLYLWYCTNFDSIIYGPEIEILHHFKIHPKFVYSNT